MAAENCDFPETLAYFISTASFSFGSPEHRMCVLMHTTSNEGGYSQYSISACVAGILRCCKNVNDNYKYQQ